MHIPIRTEQLCTEKRYTLIIICMGFKNSGQLSSLDPDPKLKTNFTKNVLFLKRSIITKERFSKPY